MFRDRLAHRLLLVYSNRRLEDAAFLAELLGLQRLNGNFRLVTTMTDMEKSARIWRGGPPAMVRAMTGMLAHAGARDEDVRSEEFFGY